MEAQDFEMPSPKRQRTESPMDISEAHISQNVAQSETSKNEAQDSKPEKQEVPDVLDFLMQHVESESKPQETSQPSTVIEQTAESAVVSSSHASAAESVLIQSTDSPHLEPVLESQPTASGDIVTETAPVAHPETQSEPDSSKILAAAHENVALQSAEPADVVADSTTTVDPAQPAAEAREWETDSSPYSSDSSDTTDSSDEDSDDDDEDDPDSYVLLDPMEQARILMAEDGGGGGDSDDEGNHTRTAKVPNSIRTTNEKPEAILPKPDVVVTSSIEIEELGTVTFFVENTLLITAKTSGEYQVLESGSVLCLGAPTYAVIGAVAETLGRVEEPLYTVRFASDTDVRETFGLNKPVETEKEANSQQEEQPQEPVIASKTATPQADLAMTLKNTKVFYVKSHSTFVFTQPLRSAKGTDASNIHDEEVGDDEQEFSDDEAEAEHKRIQKLKKKGIDPSSVPPPQSRGRGGSYRGSRGQRGGSSGYSNGYGNSSYNNNQQDAVMNYDDVPVDDGNMGSIDYTPLRRPDAFQQPQQQDYPPPSDDQRGRGRGRGGRGNFNSRGRGSGRGRGGYQNQNQGQSQSQYQQPGNTYDNASNYANNNMNAYNTPASMYPTYQPQMPTTDFSFQAQAQSQWAQYHANQNQQFQQQQYGGQPSMPNFNAEALAQVQRQLEEMRRQGQGFQ